MPKRKKVTSSSLQVICFEKNITFASIELAAQCCCINESALIQAIEEGKVIHGYTWVLARANSAKRPEVQRYMPFPRGFKKDQIDGGSPLEKELVNTKRAVTNKEARLARRIAERMVRLNTVKTLMSQDKNSIEIASRLNRTVAEINADIQAIQESEFGNAIDANEWRLLLIAQARDIQGLAMDEFVKSRRKTITKGDTVTVYEQAGDSAFLNVALSAVNFQAKVLNIADMEDTGDGGYKKFLEDLAGKVKKSELPSAVPTVNATAMDYSSLLEAPTGSIVEVEVETQTINSEAINLLEDQ